MCDEMKELISLYIDNELNPEKKAEVEEHIKNCPECKEYHSQLYQVIKELNSLPQIDLPEDFHAETMKLIKASNAGKKSIYISFARYASVAAGLLFVVTLVSVIGSGIMGMGQKIQIPEASGGGNTSVTGGMMFSMDNRKAELEEKTAQNAEPAQFAMSGATPDAGNMRAIVQQDIVIKSYNISIETEQFDQAVEIINSLNGSTLNSNVNTNYRGEKYGYYEIKYSLGNYDYAIDVIRTIGEVQSQNEYSQVLRYNYQDAAARLNAKEAERQRLLEMFNKTNTMANMLMLERRLIEVENESDYYRSELMNYSQQAANPVIYINLTERLPVEITVKSEPSLLSRVRNSFIASINLVGAFAEGLLVFMAGALIPFTVFAVIAALACWVYKMRGSKRRGEGK